MDRYSTRRKLTCRTASQETGLPVLQPTTTVDEGTLTISNLGITPTKKHFNIISIISFSFVICNSWAGVASSIQLALLQGGPVTLIYSIILSTIAYLCIALSMAELVSVYPTAGGQYHFVSILAPQHIRRAISYTCGMLSIFSWVAIGAAVTIIVAQQIMALVALTHQTFVTESWHVFLLYQAIAIWVLLFNLFILKRNSWTHNVGCKTPVQHLMIMKRSANI